MHSGSVLHPRSLIGSRGVGVCSWHRLRRSHGCQHHSSLLLSMLLRLISSFYSLGASEWQMTAELQGRLLHQWGTKDIHPTSLCVKTEASQRGKGHNSSRGSGNTLNQIVQSADAMVQSWQLEFCCHDAAKRQGGQVSQMTLAGGRALYTLTTFSSRLILIGWLPLCYFRGGSRQKVLFAVRNAFFLLFFKDSKHFAHC